jgi:preprotein translocase subunit SecE
MKNPAAPLVNYVRDSVIELKHVAWPTRREVVSHTVIIIVSVIIAMLIVALLDYGLSLLVETFILK